MSRERSSSTVDRKYQFQSMMRKYENSVCHIAWTRTGQDAASDPMRSSTRMPGS
ncbi:MAG: hypothetical protein ACJAYI_001507 [Myxococcota bacterium]|jgi:hypothetical protein